MITGLSVKCSKIARPIEVQSPEGIPSAWMRQSRRDRDVIRTRELYGECSYGDLCYGSLRERHNRPLVDFLASIPGDAEVFDIGCGSGYWLEAGRRFSLAPERAFGVDLSARSVAALGAKGFRALCGSVLDLPLAGNVSDATICNGVIHHTPDPLRAFEELVRVTRPGGFIFLSVYNRWNPYFYVVHTATAPIRWLYWNVSKRILNVIWPVSKVVVQPLARVVFGAALDERTGKALLLDHVMTPRASVFSRATVARYAGQCGCEVQRFQLTDDYMMLTAVLKVTGPG